MSKKRSDRNPNVIHLSDSTHKLMMEYCKKHKLQATYWVADLIRQEAAKQGFNLDTLSKQ